MDPLEEAMQDGELRLMLAAQLSTGQRDDKIARIFTLLGSKPKTRSVNIFPEAKAKAEDLASETKAKVKDLTLEAYATSSRTPTLPKLNYHIQACPTS